MKIRKYILSLAAVTCCSAMLLSGCSLNLSKAIDVATNETLSAEEETETLQDGNILLHIRCYDNNTQIVAGATVIFSDGDEEVFQGVTDENGRIDNCELPGNTELKCIIEDASGDQLASSTVKYKISSDYEDLSIIALHGSTDETQEIEVPVEKADFSAAIFITDSQTIEYANLMPYTAEVEAIQNAADDSSAPEEASAAAEDTAAADATADGTTDAAAAQ